MSVTLDKVCENEGTVSREGVYTRLVQVERGCYSAVVLVKPDTDFDSRFRGFDIDENEWGYFNGWACDVTDYVAN